MTDKEPTEKLREEVKETFYSRCLPGANIPEIDNMINEILSLFQSAQAEAVRQTKEGIKKYLDSLIIGIDGCSFEERLDGDKGCLGLDINQNQWDEFWQAFSNEGQ